MIATILDLIGKGEKILMEAGIDTARLDAELLIARILGKDRSQVLAHLAGSICAQATTRFEDILLRRKNREPLAYITGAKEFYSLNFKVTPDVLIPRPATETIVDTVLDLYDAETVIKVLDIGVGSGAISIALAVHRPGWQILATDSSRNALTVAEGNVKAHGMAQRVELRQSIYFDDVDSRFDLIVSNPPYIPLEADYVSPEAKLYEPHEALFAGEDGLDSIREIIAGCGKHLSIGGRLIMEIGDGQSEAIGKLIDGSEGLTLEKVVKDIGGLDRVVVMKR